jgi:hypothetical protein
MTLAVSAAPTGHTATVTPICTAEIASPEFLNESCEVFDSYGKREYPIDHEQDENNPATVWHLISTIYIPLVFLRLRKTFFGLFSFMGSILFGQFFQYHLSYLSPATWDTLAPWLELINAKDLHGKRDAWPPPTLKLLAIFTIVAFIVHPDGMTWVVLGKLRNAIRAIMESSSTCWNYVVADFGILTTIMALATFGSMLFLVFIVHRTLASRTPAQITQTDHNKKKKRKGNHLRGGGGRGARIKNKGKHHAGSRPRPVSPPLEKQTEEDKTDDNVQKVEKEDHAPMDNSERKTDFLPKQLSTKETLAKSHRPRVESSSTVDTTAMLDDQSIESASVASAPSTVSTVVSSRSPRSLNRLEEGKKKDSKKLTNKRGKKGSSSLKGYGISSASPSRTDYAYQPSSKNENSPAIVGNAAVRSRSRRGGGNQNTRRQVRSLADRMASPVPTASNNSLFSTPLSSPTNPLVHGSKTSHALSIHSLQAHTSTSPSQFSHEPTTSLPNHSATQMGQTNMFFNSSNFDASESNRITSGKVELAAFLARVGLVGTVCSDLVEALDNVDALYRLSDAQFEIYNVSSDQKLRVDMMLEARRRARVEAAFASSPRSSVRPPPGLMAPTVNQSATLLSPPRLNPATYSSESDIPSVGYMATSRTDIDFGRSSPMGGGSQTLQVPSLSSFSTYQGPSNGSRDDEEIEAELQELGGQMIGSVLDFEG